MTSATSVAAGTGAVNDCGRYRVARYSRRIWRLIHNSTPDVGGKQSSFPMAGPSNGDVAYRRVNENVRVHEHRISGRRRHRSPRAET